MKKEMLVGAVFMLALCVTAFGTIAVSGFDLFSKKTNWHVELKDLAGLQTGDDVRVLGHRMGEIGKIKFDHTLAKFKVQLVMDDDAPIYENYRIAVRDSSALGGKYLAVDPGDPGTPRPDVKNLRGERGSGGRRAPILQSEHAHGEKLATLLNNGNSEEIADLLKRTFLATFVRNA